MTGAEHAAEAGMLLKQSAEAFRQERPNEIWPRSRWLLDAAQVHATLALAAGFTLGENDVMRCGHGAIICGICGYGAPVGGVGQS